MAPDKAKRESKATAQEEAGQQQQEQAEAQGAEQEAGKTYQVSLSPQRSSIEVVVDLNGQRRAFKGGELVTEEEKEQLAQVKARTQEGSRVQALNFKEVSA